MGAYELLDMIEGLDGLDENTIVNLVEALDAKQVNLPDFFEWLAMEDDEK